MKTVGHRTLPKLMSHPSGELLKFAAAVNDPVAALLPGGKIAAPKGIYRFRTLEDMNRQQDAWLAEAMAEAAAQRK
jgi:hypothetical protein